MDEINHSFGTVMAQMMGGKGGPPPSETGGEEIGETVEVADVMEPTELSEEEASEMKDAKKSALLQGTRARGGAGAYGRSVRRARSPTVWSPWLSASLGDRVDQATARSLRYAARIAARIAPGFVAHSLIAQQPELQNLPDAKVVAQVLSTICTPCFERLVGHGIELADSLLDAFDTGGLQLAPLLAMGGKGGPGPGGASGDPITMTDLRAAQGVLTPAVGGMCLPSESENSYCLAEFTATVPQEEAWAPLSGVEQCGETCGKYRAQLTSLYPDQIARSHNYGGPYDRSAPHHPSSTDPYDAASMLQRPLNARPASLAHHARHADAHHARHADATGALSASGAHFPGGSGVPVQLSKEFTDDHRTLPNGTVGIVSIEEWHSAWGSFSSPEEVSVLFSSTFDLSSKDPAVSAFSVTVAKRDLVTHWTGNEEPKEPSSWLYPGTGGGFLLNPRQLDQLQLLIGAREGLPGCTETRFETVTSAASEYCVDRLYGHLAALSSVWATQHFGHPLFELSGPNGPEHHALTLCHEATNSNQCGQCEAVLDYVSDLGCCRGHVLRSVMLLTTTPTDLERLPARFKDLRYEDGHHGRGTPSAAGDAAAVDALVSHWADVCGRPAYDDSCGTCAEQVALDLSLPAGVTMVSLRAEQAAVEEALRDDLAQHLQVSAESLVVLDFRPVADTSRMGYATSLSLVMQVEEESCAASKQVRDRLDQSSETVVYPHLTLVLSPIAEPTDAASLEITLEFVVPAAKEGEEAEKLADQAVSGEGSLVSFLKPALSGRLGVPIEALDLSAARGPMPEGAATPLGPGQTLMVYGVVAIEDTPLATTHSLLNAGRARSVTRDADQAGDAVLIAAGDALTKFRTVHGHDDQSVRVVRATASRVAAPLLLWAEVDTESELPTHRYGPEECAYVTRALGKCILATRDCPEDSMDTFEAGFVCVHHSRKELHTYGEGIMLADEMVRTGVYCDQCLGPSDDVDETFKDKKPVGGTEEPEAAVQSQGPFDSTAKVVGGALRKAKAGAALAMLAGVLALQA